MTIEAAQTWTVARLLAWTREFFERRGMDAPRLSAEILLAHALGCERIELYTRYERVPDEAARARFREHVRRAGEGEPIAYLIGYKEFFSLRFAVSPHVLIPRPETEMLVERTIAVVRGSEGRLRRILDVGTGSGCIAVSLARHLPDAEICASDVSPEALAVARENAERHAVGQRIELRQGDLLAPWADAEPFDVIVSNPPYVATGEAESLEASVRDHEPHAALFAGPDGLALIRALIADAPGRLRPGGRLLIEIGHRHAGAVRGLLDAGGWTGIVCYKDFAQHERVACAEAPGPGA